MMKPQHDETSRIRAFQPTPKPRCRTDNLVRQHCWNRFLVLIALLATAAGPWPAAAQDPPASGKWPAGPFVEAERAKPAPAEKQPPPAAAAEAAKAPEESDPLVLAIRDSNPKTPEGLMRTVEMLVNLGRPDAAKAYVQQLAAAGLDPPAMASLHRRFGSTLFLRLIGEKQLAPEGQQLGRAVLEAVHQAVRDPQRLAALADRLSDPSPAVRHTAMVDLRQAGDAAVAPLVTVLADPARAAEHGRVQQALEQLDVAAVEPLIGASRRQTTRCGHGLSKCSGIYGPCAPRST